MYYMFGEVCNVLTNFFQLVGNLGQLFYDVTVRRESCRKEGVSVDNLVYLILDKFCDVMMTCFFLFYLLSSTIG